MTAMWSAKAWGSLPRSERKRIASASSESRTEDEAALLPRMTVEGVRALPASARVWAPLFRSEADWREKLVGDAQIPWCERCGELRMQLEEPCPDCDPSGSIRRAYLIGEARAYRSVASLLEGWADHEDPPDPPDGADPLEFMRMRSRARRAFGECDFAGRDEWGKAPKPVEAR